MDTGPARIPFACPSGRNGDRMPDPAHHREGFRDPAHPVPWTRRAFLRTGGLALAGATLYACTGGGRKIPVPSTGATSTPTTIPTRWPVKRVIYLMLENRSFNNIFGRFPGVEGTLTGVSYGNEQALHPCPDWLPGDLPHDRAAALNCMNGGSLDGFATGIYGAYFAYTVMAERQVPNYWTWAREYALSDHFFASALGPSYPNHFYYIAGQSNGVIDNPENIGTLPPKDGAKYPFKSWGCDAVGEDVFVFVKDDHGNLTKHDTCFTFRTVGEQLSEVGIDWAYYAAVPYQVGYFWNAYNGIHDVFHDRDYWNAHMRPVDALVKDIEAGKLPAVTWVTPLFQLSDHPPASSSGAHNWVTDVINAVMKSDQWNETVVFVTWDEWGGFYDQVKPPVVDDVGLGFRVPLLTIGPYVRRGLIDDEVGEFSTPLRFIADNWGLDYLSPRIANTHNFEHVFDFSKPPRPPVFATKKVKTYGGDPLDWPFDTGGTQPLWPAGTQPVSAPW